MGKRRGFLLVEALIALAIIIIALTIVYIAPSWMFKTVSYAEMEAALFDVGFSYAEEMISRPANSLGLSSNATSTIIPFVDSSSSTINFLCKLITANASVANYTVSLATFTIAPNNLVSSRSASLTFTAILRGMP